MSAEQTKAREVITTFLKRANKSSEGLTDETSLRADGLALDSLAAAELSVMLEDELGSDPFSVGGDLPQTVADVVAFYDSNAA